MNPILQRKLKILSIICVFSMIAGTLFQKFHEGFIDYNAFIVGLALGLGFGILELFVMTKFNRKLRTLPILVIIIIKTSIYTVIVFSISNILGLISGLIEGKTINVFIESLTQPFQFYLIIYSLVIFAIAIFFLQMSRLLGDGVLLRFLYGKYNKPVEEDRIFMFLDMKSSTTHAEKLGHKKFYSLLNTFFHHITEPVIDTKAEIYQYVGDEVIFTWKTDKGIQDLNCLRIFFMIKEIIEKNREYYLKEYNIVPEFKAGVHFGKVISAQIGDIKREIVFNGDVVNTTSRIQELCNVHKKELLISANLLSHIDITKDFTKVELGNMILKGKQEEINIFAIEKVRS